SASTPAMLLRWAQGRSRSTARTAARCCSSISPNADKIKKRRSGPGGGRSPPQRSGFSIAACVPACPEKKFRCLGKAPQALVSVVRFHLTRVKSEHALTAPAPLLVFYPNRHAVEAKCLTDLVDDVATITKMDLFGIAGNHHEE